MTFRVPALQLPFPQPADTPVSHVVLVLPQSYFLSRAQSLCGPERNAIPDSLRWLCHPLGQKFFMERSWSVTSAAKESLYCAQRNPGENPLQPCERRKTRTTRTVRWLCLRHVGT